MFDENFTAEQKHKLLAERQRLEVEYRHLHRPVSGDPQDTDEAAEQSEEQSVQTGEAEAIDMELEMVNQALGKIARGLYGRCQRCHRYIDRERLQAYPAATDCSQCEPELGR